MNTKQIDDKAEIAKSKRIAAIGVTECISKKELYGVRLEQESDSKWRATWAFPIKREVAEREGYTTTGFPLDLNFDAEYPGCPHCKECKLPEAVGNSSSGPLSLVLALDVSGSMSGYPIKDAKNAMLDFVNNKINFSNSNVAILVVSNKVKEKCGLTNNQIECVNAINSIKSCETGVGNSAHPFDMIKTMLQNEKGKKFAIILADGVWSKQPLAVSQAKECNSVGIETAAIGFGKADKKFLKDVSSNDANGIFVTSSGDLKSAFNLIQM
jgi:uncharacterized protein YegL